MKFSSRKTELVFSYKTYSRNLLNWEIIEDITVYFTAQINLQNDYYIS